jgi:uncharacterized protein YjdB
MMVSVDSRGHRFSLAARRISRKLVWIGAYAALSCGEVTESVEGDVAAVGVTPPTSTITVGAQLPLQALVQDAAGNAISNAAVFWSVRDPNIASVSTSGVVTGLAVGTTQVAASAGGKSAIAAITVQRVPVASVVVRPTTADATAGGRVQFTATAYDASQTALTDRPITWSSNNESMATVNANGLVTALAAGVVTITATAEGKSDAATLTITRAPVATVEVTPDPLAMSVGQTTQLTATPRDVAGVALAGRTATWSTADPAVATVSDQGIVRALTAGTTTLTATVEGKTGSATLTVSNFAVASVSVAPTSNQLIPRGSVQLTATVRDQTGAIVLNRVIAWSSSNTSVATVSPSGLVTAVAVGTASITATSEGQSGAAGVTVVPAPVASVEVNPITPTVVVLQTVALSVTLKDPEGFVITGRPVTFTSSNTSVATVSSTGVITGVAPGTATIVATSEGKSANVTATVTMAAVGSVTVQPSTASLPVGQTTALAATVRDANGTIITDRTVTWATTNGAVATVAANGVVAALTVGSATITATVDGKFGSAAITVTPAAVGSVTVQPATATVAVGQTTPLSAVVRDVTGSVVTGRVVTWSSSSNSIASVSTSGVVTGVAAGTATITATSEGRSGTATITVAAPSSAPVATVSVQPTTASVAVGQTTTLVATTRDANGNTLTGRTVTWTTSASGVATVSTSGVVTGLAPGTATITATSEGKTGTATVTVTPPPVATVTVAPLTPTVVVGGTVTLTATTKDAAGNTLTGRTVTWTTSASSIATVSTSGVVTGVAAGTATITATSEGRTGTATVTVTPPAAPVATVTVAPSTATVFVLGTTTLTATMKDATGNPLTGRSVSWSTSNPLVATVTQSGVVTGVLPGTATITATSETKSGTATITVTLVPVASVTVQPPTTTVASGSTTTLAATVTDQTGRVVTDRTVTWTSSSTAIATVSSSGVVTGKLVGAVTITASAEGKSGTSTVTVTAGPLATIRVTPATTSIKTGDMTPLAAQGLDAAGNPVSGLTFTWSSSDSSIASVNSDGRVNGKKEGTVTITAAAGGKSGTATVTVTK